MSPSIYARRARLLVHLSAAVCAASGCTVDIGENFQVAQVVYDQEYFFCTVEPMFFAQGCGSGDEQLGETAQGCHFNRQGLRLTDYEPLVAELCQGGQLAVPAPAAAQQNYQSAQLYMELDPERAELLRRPTSGAGHPREVLDFDSAEADLIRAWATRYSSQ